MYRQRFKSLLLVVLFMGTTLFGNATELKRTGWNLIAVCQDISRADINMTGIDEIQSQDGKTIYTGAFAAYSNLETLKAGYAYWVKGTAGESFDSGHAKNRLTVSLRRTGWNLLGSCENISRTDINMTNFSEIQNQDGQTRYTGTFESNSNLDGLELGVGYWVKGEMGTAFVSKRGLTLPIGFDYQTINNSGDTVETMHNGYNVRLYADYNETANDQSSHVGIVVRINGSNSPLMVVQETYQTHALVVGIYDINGSLVGVSDSIIINGNTVIDVTTIADNLPPTLTTTPPTTTTDSNTTIEVNGEVGSAVYVNGVEVATVGENSTVLVPLNLNIGDNNFSITLRDGADNESEALSFSITREATIVLTSFVKKTGQTKSYDSSGTEVLDGSVKDDGHYQKGTTPSYTRDDVNEVVTDNLTGLMWQDDAAVASVTKPWVTQSNYDAGDYFNTTGDTATTYCDELSLGGFEDWRLPTRKELQGLADYGHYNPAINTVFVNVASNDYWSSSTRANYSYGAWYVYFYSGSQYGSPKNGSFYVRCVRAGQ